MSTIYLIENKEISEGVKNFKKHQLLFSKYNISRNVEHKLSESRFNVERPIKRPIVQMIKEIAVDYAGEDRCEV